MSNSHILIELVIVLGSAAVVTVVFQALKLPVVLGYVLAGLVIGPHVPVPLVADAQLVHELSELGVILLMFTIGLELPLAQIKKVGLPGALTALFEVALVVAVGTLVARLVGFDATTAVFAGACLGISSTMLVAKAFDEHGWKGGFTEIVFAILVFEDLIAIVLLAVVTAVASGAGLDAGALALMLGKLAGFLALMLIGGLVVVPRAIRWIGKRARRETLVISSLVVCFGMAALASEAGYSVALGAFVAGVLIAESGQGHAVFSLVEVFRDVFAMMFFVSVGMSIDPSLLASEAPRILAFSAVVLVVKPVGITIGVFLTGNGVAPAVRSGLSLAQIGEFSFVIAGVLGDPTLLAIAVGVSCVTTLVSPVLIGRSENIAAWTAGRLPGGVATFVSFYEAWLERLRAREASAWSRHRRSIAVLVGEGALLIAVVIAGDQLLVGIARLAIVAVCVPLAYGMIRRAAVLAKRLAVEVVPESGGVDLGFTARRALVAMFELALALVILLPIVAILQPFVPGSLVLLLAIVLVLVVLVRRTIADFDGHVKASSALLLELLATPAPDLPLAQVSTILPGFANTATCTVREGASAVGRTLAQLDLRARTGATVLAIMRGGHGLASPSPSEPLRAHDLLALAGSADAVAAAQRLIGA